ncbi:MAG: RES family NAD+ phosphorylase [Paludibacterium sp.]|uniref:RES family NAD+ phosphorylase n=1 Tax=Paludibacterium sp. TaxID=1917523 RepID=UPI0025F2C13C|nr:RES family NAD+ phosphorylase [Paludibacterium sp.]MBV8046763.1 RES family NAD+ phosphorylase [Paludibacterium sp.]
MTVSVWRIATDAPDYAADDLTGAGAKLTGGRWNRKGVPMCYSSGSIALSCLETVVHLNAGGLPLNRYLVEVAIPDDIWQAAEAFASTDHVGWDAEPAGRVSLDFGSAWVASGRSVLLHVPSVIVPEELNILINPSHPDRHRLRVRKVRKWFYDGRIKSSR